MENGGLQFVLPKCIQCIKKEGGDPLEAIKIFVNEGTQTDDTQDIIANLRAENEALKQKIILGNKSEEISALKEALTKAERENERLLAKLYNLKNVSVKISKTIIQEKTEETWLKNKRKNRKTIEEKGEKQKTKKDHKSFGQTNVFQYQCKVAGCEFRTRRIRLMNHYVRQHDMEETEAKELMPPRFISTAKNEKVQCPKCEHKRSPLHLRRHIFQW